MVRPEHVLESWRATREETALAVEEFPAAEFDFQPVAEVASFRQIARHTLDVGEALSRLLLAGEEHFDSPDLRAKFKQHFSPLEQNASPAELAAALRESVVRLNTEFAAQPQSFFCRDDYKNGRCASHPAGIPAVD